MAPSRRGILAGALGLGGAALAQTTINPVHAEQPTTASGDPAADPAFSIDLLGQEDTVNLDGSWLREAGFRNFPVSTGISGGVISLAPGALRELHWHAHAAEWAYVISGACRVSITAPQGRSQTVDFVAGDVWYFPVGWGHAIQCVGDVDCVFVLAFDSGTHAEYTTFSLSDWVATMPDAALGRTFGVPAETFEGFHQKNAFFTRAATPPPLPSTPVAGSLNEGPWSCRYPLLAQRPTFDLPGGTVRIASQKEFPLSASMTGALIILDPGAFRPPHWHPNTNEWQYIVSGEARTTIFLSKGRSVTLELPAGHLAYVPRGCGHFTENVGSDTLEVVTVFDSGVYESIEMRDWVGSNTPELLAANFRQPEATTRPLVD